MFDLWKLKRKQIRTQKRVMREINEAMRTKTPPVIDDFVAQRTRQLSSIHDEIKEWHTYLLVNEAVGFDIELPRDDSAWEPDKAQGRIGNTLTPAGRSELRQLIDAEKTRRREVKAWWWKNVVIPAITALTGLAGVITGMIAVIHAKK